MAIMPGEDTSKRPTFIPGVLTVWFSHKATIRTVYNAVSMINGKVTEYNFKSGRFSIEIEPGQEDEMIVKLSFFKSTGDILSVQKQDIEYVVSP